MFDNEQDMNNRIVHSIEIYFPPFFFSFKYSLIFILFFLLIKRSSNLNSDEIESIQFLALNIRNIICNHLLVN
jgi:hypothetical protein